MRGWEHLIVRSDGGRQVDGLVDQVGVPAAGWHWPCHVQSSRGATGGAGEGRAVRQASRECLLLSALVRKRSAERTLQRTLKLRWC